MKKRHISRELLEEVLILAHYFDLSELVYLATSQFFYMAMNPRLRFSVRRHNEDLKKWLDFAIRQQIYYVHPKLLKSRTRSTSARAYPLMSLWNSLLFYLVENSIMQKNKINTWSQFLSSFLIVRHVVVASQIHV